MERPIKEHRKPTRLQDYEVNLDDDGELVHFAFLADSEPVELKIPFKIPNGKGYE